MLDKTFILLRRNPVVVIPLSLYFIFQVAFLDQPALYMDAVNPDYLATWLLKGSYQTPAWIYPDNMLMGPYALPILNSLYGGNLVAYLWLVFAGVFGFGAVNVHVFHMILGAILVFLVQRTLVEFKVSAPIGLFSGILLAINSNFLLSWRTQYYLQLFASIFFVLGILLAAKSFTALQPKRRNQLKAFALVSLGFATFQYFIFFLYAVPFIVFLSRTGTEKRSYKEVLAAISYFLIGWAPYVYAHLSILLQVGYANYLKLLADLQSSYGVIEGSSGLLDRLGHTFGLVYGVLVGSSVPKVVFATAKSMNLGFKMTVVLLVLGILFFASKREVPNFKGLLVGKSLVYGVVLHIAFSLVIGNSLQNQHFIMLLPLVPLIVAILLDSRFTFQKWGQARINKFRPAVILLILAPALFGTLTYSLALSNDNNRTQAYSRDIQRVTAFLTNSPSGDSVIFTQWGYWMSYVVANGPHGNVYAYNALGDFQSDSSPERFDCKPECSLVVQTSQLGDVKDQAALESGLEKAGLVRIYDDTRIGSISILHLRHDE